MRQRIYLNDGWGFSTSFDETMCTLAYDTSQLETVRLPHSVVETPYNYFDEELYQMISGYRRVFKTEESWRNKKVLLTIEAAAHQAEVFINGENVLKHYSGYTAFGVDLAPYLKWDEENVLVIKVDSHESLNIPPFGNVIDYMTYGGIYREVYLDVVEESYLSDVFPKVLDVDTNKAIFEVEVSVENEADTTVSYRLEDSNGNEVELKELADAKYEVNNITLWTTDTPALYTLKTNLIKANEVIDEIKTRIGFRTIEAKSDGLYINKKKFKLRGLDRHQSYPYVGYAMPKSMQVRDAEILKYELGLNAVRTSHYPQSHYFLDACDELGLLVFTEIPGWQHIGNAEWKEIAVKNTEEMVLQYRNHPSIFLWGVRINESMDDDELYTKTNEVAHKLDSTRPTSGVRFIQKSSLLEDVYAYNDFSHDGKVAGCLKRSKVTPNMNKGYLISEYNGHMFPTKMFDAEDHRVEHMLRHTRVVNAYYGEEDIYGGFGWCMFDYNTHKDFGSGDRICYHGVLDMFRNPKMAAAVYSSQSTRKDVLEITSSMDIGEHPACLSKDVYAITNADSIKLYKNNQFIREFTRNNSEFKNMPYAPILIDDFIGELIEKGEGYSHSKAEEIKKILLAANKYGMNNLPVNILLLAAKCMLLRGMKMQDAVDLYYKYISNWGGSATIYRFDAIKDGKVVSSVEKRPMSTVKFKYDVSHTTLIEDNTYDVAAIRLEAVSETGNRLPFYQEGLRFETEGDIELIGPSLSSFKGGMAGTYVKSVGVSGEGILKVIGEGLEPIVIEFNVERGK